MIDKSTLWNEFARLWPGRWKLYDGYCRCELCEDYRARFEEWSDAIIARAKADAKEQT